MIEGILAAYNATGVAPPKVFTGDYAVGFLQEWINLAKQGYNIMVEENPPGYTVSAAIYVAINLLQGKHLDPKYMVGNTLYLPLPPAITNANVSSIYSQYQNYPSSWLVDYIFNNSQILPYFA